MRRSYSVKPRRSKSKVRFTRKSRSMSRSHSKSKKRTVKKKLHFERKVKSALVKGGGYAINTYQEASSVQLYSNYTNSTTSPAAPGVQIFMPFMSNPVSIYTQLYTSLSTNGSVKSFVRRWETLYLITNRVSAPIYLKIYTFIARKDLPSSASSLTAMLVSSLTAQKITPGGGTFSTPSLFNPGYTPFMNREFCVFFKVLNTREIMVPPGGCVKHKIGSRKFTPIEKTTDTSALLLARKGQQKGMIIQAYGAATNDSKTTTATTTTEVVLDVAQVTNYSYTYPGDWDYNTVSGSAQLNQTLVTQEMSSIGVVGPALQINQILAPPATSVPTTTVA